MALYLPESGALFIHIPKCGGHFVEQVLKHHGIKYRWSTPTDKVCLRHSRAKDHPPAEFTFCTIRELKSWMRSYWTFHMCQGHNRLHWDEDVHYPHRRLGPPMDTWQAFEQRTDECQAYLDEMVEGCDEVLPIEDIPNGLSRVLTSLGYDITPEQVASVPRANKTHLKVELGGGSRAYGNGFANIDVDPAADFNWDLNVAPYPFPDSCVDELYSSHCLEHLQCPHRTFREIVRICKPGAKVEIRVPHPQSQMAMCAGHEQVIGPVMIENMCVHFPEIHWPGSKKLTLVSMHYNPTTWLHQARTELPFLKGLSDQTVMKWIPNAAHETVFIFKVENNV